jgi:hypothetical protein
MRHASASNSITPSQAIPKKQNEKDVFGPCNNSYKPAVILLNLELVGQSLVVLGMLNASFA